MTSSSTETLSLRRVQETMLARILDCASPSGDAAPWIGVPPGAFAGERLGVYENGYPARIHDALADTFPALARLVGPAAFAALARRYAAAVPLTSYNLNDAGAALPAFLRDDERGRERPFLPDLAALEWRVAQAFHAFEHRPLDPAALSWTVDDWERAGLAFQPSVAVVRSPWPLLALWSGTMPAEEGVRPTAGAAESVLVRRVGLIVRCEAITTGEADALCELLNGRSLGACMTWLEAAGHDPAAVGAWCARWMQSGMIAAARLVG